MASYELSGLAGNDLAKIYEYGILNFGLTQAQDYLLGLHERFQALANNQLPGMDASQFATNLKRSLYKREVIFYQALGSDILIVRVLGANMDFVRHLDTDH